MFEGRNFSTERDGDDVSDEAIAPKWRSATGIWDFGISGRKNMGSDVASCVR